MNWDTPPKVCPECYLVSDVPRDGHINCPDCLTELRHD